MLSNAQFERLDRSRAIGVGIRRFVAGVIGLIVVVVVIASVAIWAASLLDDGNQGQTYGGNIRATVSEHWENVTEREGPNPGPVEPLGYPTEGEAAANCEAPAVVRPLYRQYQIVGYSCVTIIE